MSRTENKKKITAIVIVTHLFSISRVKNKDEWKKKNWIRMTKKIHNSKYKAAKQQKQKKKRNEMRLLL